MTPFIHIVSGIRPVLKGVKRKEEKRRKKMVKGKDSGQ